MKFKLDIYTWPAFSGVDPKTRRSDHESAEEADLHLSQDDEPYAYAVLHIETESGVFRPCDWEGNVLRIDQPWPHRIGQNGQHPASAALMADWYNLVATIRDRYGGTEGMIDIARELLQERHPGISGYAYELAWEAAG